MQKQLLEGIRALDFGWVATGPITAKYLADCGAEVIKVEGRTRPDTHRTSRAVDGVIRFNQSLAFNQYSTSKKSLCLNLTRPKAVEVAKKLIAISDVVSENMGTGAMDRLGLSYEDLKKIKPDIIVLGSSMQGRTGPAANSRGWGNILVGLSGFSQIAGWPDHDPAELGFYTDWIAPHFNAVAIMAALLYRRRTGKGMYIDMSQLEAGLHFLTPLLLDYTVNGRIANREGNRSDYAAPHAAYRCKGAERWCAIAVSSEEEWQKFCKVIGNPSWTKDAKFSTFLARKKNEEELDKLVEQWTQQHTAEEVMEKLQTAGVPAGVVETGEDQVEHDPQLAYRKYLVRTNHAEVGPYLVHRTPFLTSKSAQKVGPAPLLGEHNEYVLKELLGFSDDDIADLVIDGAVE